MTIPELKNRILTGEDSFTQFKTKSIRARELAKEFVAFSNAEGGVILFGVSDEGIILGLARDEVEEIGQLVGNVANENVKPPIYPLSETISIEDKIVIVVSIREEFRCIISRD